MTEQPSSIDEVLLCLEAIRDSTSTHRRSLEGTIWMLKNRVRLVYSVLASAPGEDDRSSSDCDPIYPSTQTAVSFSGLSAVSTTDSLTVSSTAQAPCLTIGCPTQTTSTPAPSCWTPSSWFLRTKVPERRQSGDAALYQTLFQKRRKCLGRRFRRRKTVSEETLDLAAAQGHQISLIRESTAHHSNPVTPPIVSGFTHLTYRRSRSAVTVADVSMMTESPGAASARTLRKHSLSGVGGYSEVWPETITGLLTGGQLLIDRSILFSRLAEELERNNSTSLEHDGNQKFNQREVCCPTMVKKTTGLRMRCGGVSIPRPDKTWGGEDAFFFSTDGSQFAGVADGVGEWGELGCNPRQFAEELMEGAKVEASLLQTQELLQSQDLLRNDDDAFEERACLRAQRVLGAGLRAAKSFGSSTALIAGLDSEGRNLGVANIGDSACLVLRRESKCHRHFIAFRRTKEQQHFFNCPYQLSKVPTQEDLPELASKGMHRLVRALSTLSSRVECDTPEMADLYDMKVQEGDLVILATDGVFDNLFDQEIASLASLAISPHEAGTLSKILSPSRNGFLSHPNAIIPPIEIDFWGFATPAQCCGIFVISSSCQNIAQAISEAAFYRSLDPRARTPFARQSRRAGGFFAGGKMDDITTVVAWII